MSRSGKIPIAIPKGVEVNVVGNQVSVKGPKETQTLKLPAGIRVAVGKEEVSVSSETLDASARRVFGLTRALIKNMVIGVSTGFQKKLEIEGVGYRAAVKGKQLDIQIGASHPTSIEIPEGISVKIEEGVRITISGANAQKTGQFAASVREMKPPEPYKGKGIRYAGEQIRRKVGKTAKK
jgi:large subunit ribosomal protein L6